MSKTSKVRSATLAVALLASGILSSAAVAAPVAPKKPTLAVTTNGCPAQFTLRARIIAKHEGHVLVRFQRDDGVTSAPVWVFVPKRKKAKNLTVYKKMLPAVPAAVNAKYRVIAMGAGTTAYSNWSELRNGC